MPQRSITENTTVQGVKLTKPHLPSRLFNPLGKKFISWIDNLGAALIFFCKAFLLIFRSKQIPAIIQQVFYIGAKSSNIVMLVGLFTGMVLGLQLYYTLVQFGSEGVLGSAVAHLWFGNSARFLPPL